MISRAKIDYLNICFYQSSYDRTVKVVYIECIKEKIILWVIDIDELSKLFIII